MEHSGEFEIIVHEIVDLVSLRPFLFFFPVKITHLPSLKQQASVDSPQPHDSVASLEVS